MNICKNKIFIPGDIVETELSTHRFPRHYFNEFFEGTGLWVVGTVISIDNLGDGPELVVDFGSQVGTHGFPLAGHAHCIDSYWYRNGSLRHYNSGATRDPHCDHSYIKEIGSIPYSSMDENYYRSYFRGRVMNTWRKWPSCKVEDKTLDIKHYLSNDGRVITATFECQHCCF